MKEHLLSKIKKLIKFLFEDFFILLTNKQEETSDLLKKQIHLQIESYLQVYLYNNKRYHGNKRLNKFEYQVYSQYGEDGIIEEIFKRIGTTNKYFVEFGVENGLECNTTYLLLKNWSGLWIEGNENYYNEISKIFHNIINVKLSVINKFVGKENIEAIFNIKNVPLQFDLLSIDIDYNDYHIWEAIRNYKPRVLVIEYNSTVRDEIEYVVQYNEHGNGGEFTSHYGASLHSLELLSTEKGYSLVGCSFSGVNAFFVRNDCLSNLFEAPYTSINHYESTRHFLYNKNGHKRYWGNLL